MKNRMEKFRTIRNLLAISIFGILFFPVITLADGNISISPDSAFFNITNAAPGGEYESSQITVTNSGTEAEQLQFSVNIKTNPENLTQLLYMKVNDENGVCLVNCDWAKNLDNTTEILIGPLPAGSSEKYTFVVLFDKNAGNVFQNATTIFDIIVGFEGSTVTPLGDNDDDGDNDNDKKNNNAPISLTAGTNLNQEAGALAASTLTPTPISNVEGEATAGEADGEIAGTENACQSWPNWVWILALIIFAGLLGIDTRNKYEKEEYGWKFPAVWTALAVAFWYFFDDCREFPWFWYGSIGIAIILQFILLHFLKKKVGKTPELKEIIESKDDSKIV